MAYGIIDKDKLIKLADTARERDMSLGDKKLPLTGTSETRSIESYICKIPDRIWQGALLLPNVVTVKANDYPLNYRGKLFKLSYYTLTQYNQFLKKTDTFRTAQYEDENVITLRDHPVRGSRFYIEPAEESDKLQDCALVTGFTDVQGNENILHGALTGDDIEIWLGLTPS